MVRHGAWRGCGFFLTRFSIAIAALSSVIPAHTASIAGRTNFRPCLPAAKPSVIAVKTSLSAGAADAPVQATTIDDGAPGWIWSGMQGIADRNLHDETGHAGGPGTYGEYTFTGTRVAVFGMAGPAAVTDGRPHKMGRARVSIDGVVRDTVSMARDTSQYDVRVATIDGLSPGNHVLQIAADGGWIVVDYIRTATIDATPKAAPRKEAIVSAVAEGNYRLIPKFAPDRCLEFGPQSAHGVQLQIGAQNPAHEQIWHVTPLGRENYQIAPASDTGQMIWIPSAQVDINTLRPLILWQATSAPEQILHFTQIESGVFRIELSTNPDTVMDVSGASPTEGTPVIASKWGSYDNQKWSFAPAGQ